MTHPVAIGGVGGSGTRVVAGVLREMGVYLGADLNEALDNLWFTLLFKRVEILEAPDDEFAELVRIFRNAMLERRPPGAADRALVAALAAAARPQNRRRWLRARAASLLASDLPGHPPDRRWGWKEPNTHVVLASLLDHMPDLSYVHVMRHGLDMAYSTNQKQLRLWGGSFLPGRPRRTARDSLRFWCEAQRRVLAVQQRLPERVWLLDFDRLCADPEPTLAELLAFAGLDASAADRRRLAGTIRPPSGIGRYRRRSLAAFEPADVEFVRSLGFEVP